MVAQINAIFRNHLRVLASSRDLSLSFHEVNAMKAKDDAKLVAGQL